MSPKDMRAFLSEESVAQIHATTLRYLENIGVDFPCADALAVFQRHGIRTDGSLVYLTEAQLFNALHAAPRHFTIEARNPARSVTIGEGRPGLRARVRRAVPGGRGRGRARAEMRDYDTLAARPCAPEPGHERTSHGRAGRRPARRRDGWHAVCEHGSLGQGIPGQRKRRDGRRRYDRHGGHSLRRPARPLRLPRADQQPHAAPLQQRDAGSADRICDGAAAGHHRCARNGRLDCAGEPRRRPRAPERRVAGGRRPRPIDQPRHACRLRVHIHKHRHEERRAGHRQS